MLRCRGHFFIMAKSIQDITDGRTCKTLIHLQVVLGLGFLANGKKSV